MAVLTNADFRAYKFHLRNDPEAKDEIRAAALSKPQLKAAFQALEDSYTSSRPAFKAAVDAAAGVTLTNAFARKIEDAWMTRKAVT